MKRTSRTRIVLAIAILIPIAVVVSGFAALLITWTHVDVYAYYGDGIKLHGTQGQYCDLYARATSTSDLYVEIPAEGCFQLRDLPEDVVRRTSRSLIVDGGYHLEGTAFFFTDGRLETAWIGDGVSFGFCPDGDFIQLPVQYEKAHQVLGRPDRIERKREFKSIRWN